MTDLRNAAQAVIDACDAAPNSTVRLDIALRALRAALAEDASIASREIDTSGVPAGFWLAPMEPDAGMLMAFHEGERYGFKTWGDRYAAMRDYWLSRHPTSGTEGEQA